MSLFHRSENAAQRAGDRAEDRAAGAEDRVQDRVEDRGENRAEPTPDHPEGVENQGATRVEDHAEQTEDRAEDREDRADRADASNPAGGAASYRDRVTELGLDRSAVLQREKERYGGVKIGSAFFGWLAATGTGVLLAALVVGAGGALGVASNTPAGQTVAQAT